MVTVNGRKGFFKSKVKEENEKMFEIELDDLISQISGNGASSESFDEIESNSSLDKRKYLQLHPIIHRNDIIYIHNLAGSYPHVNQEDSHLVDSECEVCKEYLVDTNCLQNSEHFNSHKDKNNNSFPPVGSKKKIDKTYCSSYDNRVKDLENNVQCFYTTDELKFKVDEIKELLRTKFNIPAMNYEPHAYIARNLNKRENNMSAFKICAAHSKENLVLYCYTCNVPMCSNCKADLHRYHKFDTLESAMIKFRGNVKRLQKQIEDKNQEIENSLSEHINYLDELKIKRDEIRSQIDNHYTNLYEFINQWYENTTAKLDAEWSPEIDTISSEIEDTKSMLNNLREANKEIKDILEMKKSHEFFSLMNQLNAHVKDLTDYKPPKLENQLCAIFTNGTEISQKMLGSLYISKNDLIDQRLYHLSFGKCLISFNTRPERKSDTYASGISILDDENLLVSDIGTDIVKVFTKEGIYVRTLNTLPHDNPTQAVQYQDEHIVVACRSGLKLFNLDGEYARTLSGMPDLPQALATSVNGDLVVSDSVESGGVLHILTGKHLKLIHSIIGGLRAPVFEKPWYITVDHKNHIFLSDYNDHVIKVVSPFGMLLREFGGKGYLPGQFFHPAGICMNKYGHVLVADCNNNRVQMFTNEGEFLGIILNGSHNNLSSPTDLAIDADGNLIVLQGNGWIKIFKYIY